MTKDRVGAVLAIAAAIVGLALVFGTHNTKADSDDDDQAGSPASTSQVQAPDVDDTRSPSVTPVPSGPPAPPVQPPKNDNDDDD